MDRLQHKHSLFVKLGALFGPLQHLIAHPDQYDEQERAEVLGRYCAEYSILEKEFRDFVEGQPGHRYLIQYSEFSSALNSVRVRLTGKQSLEIVVNEEFTKAVSAIDAVPIPRQCPQSMLSQFQKPPLFSKPVVRSQLIADFASFARWTRLPH